jgi:multidrug efflux pump subunit AcrA (membrane-fusion protein)
MQLDFSLLTDDQLIDLIRTACMEAARRGTATQLAAEAAMLDEAEKARIARAAAERAQAELAREEAARIAREAADKVRAQADAAKRREEEEQIAKNWEYKDHIGAQLSAILKPKGSYQLKVWLRGADKRIYIGGGYKDNIVEYYHTGNKYEKPRTIHITSFNLHLSKADLSEAKAQLLPVLESICTQWAGIIIPIPAWSDAQQEVA